ncbi:hypothetical protein GCM10007972_04650 [Iodidimonas muriae]|uniref:Endolytic peptidoglycan transglycosylase RlpA n=1 Tax=Iodidimonas muriae TaxID=261467 RepID=A0ABQ2L810_9PROT|nr:hypothetical protein JCM17843_24900 [Kordiimonadales bacterium JCM 17843]GGO06365.1 hypothetical protein GCM10007972_04650 [Iodidimonas muriae]
MRGGGVIRVSKLATPLILALAVAACGGGPRVYAPSSPPSPTGAQKVGKPYQVAGIWYYPAHDHDYDEVGTASWYGPKFHGRPTANGEVFDMNKVSAAHPTLPLPSHVRVTNLDNGRAITVRINDRGPFARGRILDLSRRAAQLLGFEKQGTAKVRVQLVRSDGSIADARNAPTVQPRQIASNEQVLGPLFVQIGSFSDVNNARKLRQQLSGIGKISIETADTHEGVVYRVRIGPFKSERDARQMLDRVFKRGFYGARIFTDRLG